MQVPNCMEAMGRAILMLVAVVVAVTTAAPASAHPIGLHVAPLRQATAVRPRPQAQRHDDVFTLVEAQNGAVVRSRPNGRIAGELPGRTPLGTTTWLWAVKTSPDGRWAQVVLPWRPNGRTGWISLRGRRTVKSSVWVDADVSRRRVNLMRGSQVMRSFVAAVGAPASPTPVGRFSVTDPIATGDPGGPFGWYAFGLSGHQPNLPAGWSGGDQLAIHGTNTPWSLGTAASAGCLRVASTALVTLKRYLHPGTPVIIEA
jgi:lipoprotein-anchoring transpeptidase ErfK/SrfK